MISIRNISQDFSPYFYHTPPKHLKDKQEYFKELRYFKEHALQIQETTSGMKFTDPKMRAQIYQRFSKNI